MCWLASREPDYRATPSRIPWNSEQSEIRYCEFTSLLVSFENLNSFPYQWHARTRRLAGALGFAFYDKFPNRNNIFFQIITCDNCMIYENKIIRIYTRNSYLNDYKNTKLKLYVIRSRKILPGVATTQPLLAKIRVLGSYLTVRTRYSPFVINSTYSNTDSRNEHC